MHLQRGFTLIELLVGMALVAVVMAIGVPSYKNIAASSRISGEINALLGDLQYARAEAIKEGQTVTVCTGTVAGGCSGSSSWNAGWIIFSDTNANHVLNTNTGDVVLRSQLLFPGTDTVSASNSLNWIMFNREGFITQLPANPVVITFRPSNVTTSQWTRCLSIGSIGRLTIQQNSTTPACV